MASTGTKRVIGLTIAIIAGLVGFGDDLFGSWLPPDISALLQEAFGGVLVGLCKIVFVFLVLFFVVSLCFGKHLRGRHFEGGEPRVVHGRPQDQAYRRRNER